MVSNPRQKSFNKPFEFLLYVYCNRSQKTSQRVKNNSHATRLCLVSYFFVLYTLWRHLWSITVHTHTRTNVIYLLIKDYTSIWHVIRNKNSLGNHENTRFYNKRVVYFSVANTISYQKHAYFDNFDIEKVHKDEIFLPTRYITNPKIKYIIGYIYIYAL